MPALVHRPCKSFYSLLSPSSLSQNHFNALPKTPQHKDISEPPKYHLAKSQRFNSVSATGSFEVLVFTRSSFSLRSTQVCFCSKNDVMEELRTTQLPQDQENKVELLGKPSLKQVNNEELEPQKPGEEEVLKPFLRFFKPKESLEQTSNVEETSDAATDEVRPVGDSLPEKDELRQVSVEYYEPKPGDFVVGVVVSGNDNKLDVNIGADFLGSMLTKEVLPLYDKELDNLLFDTRKDVGEFLVRGKMGIVKDEDDLSGQLVTGRPVVEPGTVLFAEVLGRTLSGRPLLSTRRLFRRVAWQRVRQIAKIKKDIDYSARQQETQRASFPWYLLQLVYRHRLLRRLKVKDIGEASPQFIDLMLCIGEQIKLLNEPIEVKITEWNTGGLITRIEGLRAFLPKAELTKRINHFTELKDSVGKQIYVQIARVNEDTNDLILSEREAWNKLNLTEGTLLEGTIQKIFPYGAQVRIGESNRSGLLHISNISRARIASVSDVLAVDEKVKVLVVNSLFPEKIALSTADLESEPGLFLSNKEKVYSEAEQMVKKYRQKMPAVSESRKLEALRNIAIPFEDEESLYANWKWFKFEEGN